MIFIVMKKLIIFFVVILSFNLYSQIKIDDVGENWKNNVTLSLEVIKKHDKEKYDKLLEVCKKITFYSGKYSTIEEPDTIVITQLEMVNFNVNNVAAVIVHESKHLFLRKNNIILFHNDEEKLCYEYELDFLNKIPSVEPWLITHTKNMIIFFTR